MKKAQYIAGKIVTYFLLTCFFIFILVPFVMIVLTALKNPSEITDMPNRTLWHRIIPDSFANFENIKAVFFGYASQLNGVPFYRFIYNSLIVTVCSLIPSLFLALTSAYGFAKYEFPAKNIVFYMFLGLVMIPMEMVSIPLFMIISRMGLINTYAGMMVPGFISAFGTFLLKESIEPIPLSYIEAGRIDGAGEFWIFRKIIVPMIKGPIVTFIVIKATWSWNDFFWPLLVVTEEKMKTVTLGLSKFSNDLFKEYGQLTAAVLLSIIPLLIVFIFCNRNIKSGLMSAGVKG
ncbi:carbohydrate ABC transporter permease [Breznakiella homolactica]|uniref:sn-glycerol-3-phosphate transport system permease protein UgpE n=1 Tax=Breznakiella homolactica TaxID=2798577 RepID=A0A7T8BD81_9SPIR|nr:carbohydrate ABC transporter permease [Breznakiella homolactica]QQO10983.1 carbohydrate ABC transporter permease [Breznakiella homolactica]